MEPLTVSNPNKRINVISKHIIDSEGNVIQEAGILMRTTRSYASKLIAAGTHSVTSKSKLKSFLVRERKLHRNERTLNAKMIDLNKIGNAKGLDKKHALYEIHKKSELYRDEYNGKTYLALWKKDVPTVMMSKGTIDATTGKPKEFTVDQPKHQLLILRFPS